MNIIGDFLILIFFGTAEMLSSIPWWGYVLSAVAIVAIIVAICKGYEYVFWAIIFVLVFGSFAVVGIPTLIAAFMA